MGKVRLKFRRQGFIEILTSDAALAIVSAKAEAIEAACNAQSSWGGYHSSADNGLGGVKADKNGRLRDAAGRFITGGHRARAVVWSADNRNDEARDNRLIHNLDAG